MPGPDPLDRAPTDIAGWLSEATLAGASFLRIDIPGDPPATQLYAAGSVYAITPCDEQTARLAAKITRPAPVQRWELPAEDTEVLPHDDPDLAF